RERRLQSHPHRPVRDDQHPRRRYLHRQVAPQAPEQAVSRRPFPESLRSHRQTGHHQRAAGPNKRAPLMKTRTSMALLLFAATTPPASSTARSNSPPASAPLTPSLPHSTTKTTRSSRFAVRPSASRSRRSPTTEPSTTTASCPTSSPGSTTKQPGPSTSTPS